MSDLLTVTSSGRRNWLSWLVAEEVYASGSDRARLIRLRHSFQPAVAPLADEFTHSHWREVPLDEARLLTADRAKKGIAYNSFALPRRLLSHPRVNSFFADFSDAARAFTNWGEIIGGGCSGGWQPFTQSTFDLAVGVVDGKKIGIFCIEDED